jgi:hypothetical protein
MPAILARRPGAMAGMKLFSRLTAAARWYALRYHGGVP